MNTNELTNNISVFNREIKHKSVRKNVLNSGNKLSLLELIT